MPHTTGPSRPSPPRPSAILRALPPLLVLLAGLVLAAPVGAAPPPGGPLAATRQAATAEEQLAQKYAPISYLKRQDEACDEEGEPFLPAPVNVAFDDPAVVLRQAPDRRELVRKVEGADLFGRDQSYYVDLPGHPRTPGCDYERHFKQQMGDRPPVVYANVATEEGKDGLAVQYWFWYYYNDFNNKHEGDWEMIQLLFAANTAEEALEQEPVAVAFAQHSGGETAEWNDPKLEREAGHPVSYPSRGSHASYYGPGIWLGWGQAGSGLGCDDTTGPSVRVAPEVRLVPDDVPDPAHPFAWATFGGRWGERDTWVYDGPKGPNLNPRWTNPITWQEGLRVSSLQVRSANVLGPTSTDVFCELVTGASETITLLQPYPWALGGALAALAALGVWLVLLTWPILRAAWSIYVAHWPTFAAIGAVLIPLTLIVNGFHYLLTTDPGFAAWVGLSEDGLAVQAGMSLILAVQQVALLALVGPAVIQAVAAVDAGQRPSFRHAYGVALSRFWSVVGARLRAFVITIALTISIIGIPWAIARTVRWAFVTQAVVLDGATAKSALAVSAAAVRGRWWQTLAIRAVLLFVGAALGPILGIALMVFARAPLDLANGAGAVAYALTHPLAIIGATILYRRLQALPETERRPLRLGNLRRRLAPGTV